MSNQGTIRLKVFNGAPSINKLWNGRYQVEFLCDNNNPKEDWHHDNISSILPDYGILQEANFGSGVNEDWEAIPGSVYPDMRLVSANYEYIASIGDKRVQLTYETLTSSWVEEKAEDTDHEINGLKRVLRTFVALPGTVYDKVVGTSTVDSNGTTLYLGSFKIEETDAKWSLSEIWLEAGSLSQSEDKIGSQKSIVIESIGEVPTAPLGYVLANTQLSNVEGFTTTRHTFLKPGILSSVINEENGGNTTTGIIRTEVIESFGQVAVTTIGGILIGTQVSDFEGIPTNRYTFVKANGSIRTSSRQAPASLSGCTYVTVESVGTEITPPGVLTEASEINDDGFVRWVKTALQGNVTGIKQEYKDVMEVDVPGTVDCTTVAVESGGTGGTIAITQVVPRRRKKIIANVEIKVSTVSEGITQLAFDLGQISCSVSTTNYSLQKSPNTTLVYTNYMGFTSSVTGENKNFSAGASTQSYPGCYLTDSSSTGSVTFDASRVPVLTASGNYHTFNTITTSRTTKCVGSGSTDQNTYFETGVIKRNSRPIFTALNGTTYYEVITWSA